jgi:hypothetical protein
MEEIKVVNKKFYKGKGEYVGRGTPLGNRFIIGKDGTRKEVIELYRRWLWELVKVEDVEIMDELKRLLRKWETDGKLVLICYCKPKPCHADIIKNALIWLNKKGRK